MWRDRNDRHFSTIPTTDVAIERESPGIYAASCTDCSARMSWTGRAVSDDCTVPEVLSNNGKLGSKRTDQLW